MLGRMLKRLTGELYRVTAVDGGFVLTISRALYDYLLETLSEQKDAKRSFLEIRTVLHTDVVKFELVLPFIRFPNRSHRKMDWEALWKRSEQMGYLLDLFNYANAGDEHPHFYLSANPQLMMISIGIVRGGGVSGCPIELGFHQSAFDVLTVERENDLIISEAEELILKFYSGMSCQTMKEKASREKNFRKYGASFTGIRAMVRAGGIPHFIVPGNCACLGANPEEFKYSLSMYSHNIDSPLQQLSMLAGIASFWNDFLVPRWQAKQVEKTHV